MFHKDGQCFYLGRDKPAPGTIWAGSWQEAYIHPSSPAAIKIKINQPVSQLQSLI